MKEVKISEENALAELKKFIHKWVKKPVSDDKLADEYSDILEAIMSGNLEINSEFVPTYTLVHPIKNDSGEVSRSVVNFKTRVKPTVKADLASGLDLQKQTAKYSLILIAHVIGVTTAELDKFEREDYDVIQELSAVFM
jgi:hypothetical protein